MAGLAVRHTSVLSDAARARSATNSAGSFRARSKSRRVTLRSAASSESEARRFSRGSASSRSDPVRGEVKRSWARRESVASCRARIPAPPGGM